MLNYDTLLSSYDDKLTLMQWLKKVEAALKDASAVSFNINKRGDATLTFSIVFEDGSELETGPIVLEQGESVASAAIVNGHLILTLTNGDELDAGDLGGVSGFSIDASQHLIVTYQNGTTQDLGAIFQGNVNITGSLAADTLEQQNANFEGAGAVAGGEYLQVENVYNRVTIINKVMHVVFNIKITNISDANRILYGFTSNNIDIPVKYRAKVIDRNGDNLNVYAEPSVSIREAVALITGLNASPSFKTCYCALLHRWNGVLLSFTFGGLTTLAPNETIYVTSEMNLPL